LKKAHIALEEKYQMILESIENEREKHREYRKKSEDLVSVIGKLLSTKTIK